MKKATKSLRAYLSWRDNIMIDSHASSCLPWRWPFQPYGLFGEVINPPSLFSYLYKGVRPFVELSAVTMVVSLLDFEESLEFYDFHSYPRVSSLQFEPSSIKPTTKDGLRTSLRFSFVVSQHFDSLKLWYLTLNGLTALKSAGHHINGYIRPTNKTLFPSTPMSHHVTMSEPIKISQLWMPWPSFLQSPTMFFKKDCKIDKAHQSFLSFLRFYIRSFDEILYRSEMCPPLGGLISSQVTPGVDITKVLSQQSSPLMK
ncbi:hypothetical protein K2173_024191 [Erythroxylum novogranatense]|uniref:Uncharacterized protein n=1 Tax=Erythroxylum novogranatense TaxID=1862640 RepID=A0AAV8UC59_9ROSI|nr:hypothetical protein K2173_024191 [Erythroxylum novogranatense]